jgi:hypothetical protein
VDASGDGREGKAVAGVTGVGGLPGDGIGSLMDFALPTPSIDHPMHA